MLIFYSWTIYPSAFAGVYLPGSGFGFEVVVGVLHFELIFPCRYLLLRQLVLGKGLRPDSSLVPPFRAEGGAKGSGPAFSPPSGTSEARVYL